MYGTLNAEDFIIQNIHICQVKLKCEAADDNKLTINRLGPERAGCSLGADPELKNAVLPITNPPLVVNGGNQFKLLCYCS